MTYLFSLTSFLPIALFFILWVGFPVWLALRRAQGQICIEKTDHQGEKKQIGMYFELGIFIFAIPFTTFFLLVTINLALSPFIADIGRRFQKSLEISLIVMAIVLFLYIYFAERKIYLKRLNNRENPPLNEENINNS